MPCWTHHAIDFEKSFHRRGVPNPLPNYIENPWKYSRGTYQCKKSELEDSSFILLIGNEKAILNPWWQDDNEWTVEQYLYVENFQYVVGATTEALCYWIYVDERTYPDGNVIQKRVLISNE